MRLNEKTLFQIIQNNPALIWLPWEDGVEIWIGGKQYNFETIDNAILHFVISQHWIIGPFNSRSQEYLKKFGFIENQF